MHWQNVKQDFCNVKTPSMADMRNLLLAAMAAQALKEQTAFFTII
jgi:hypothetical protein